MRKFLIASTAFALLSGCIDPDPEMPEIGSLVRSMGFTEVRPPNLFVSPASVVVIRSAAPFEAGVVCEAKNTVGPMTLPISPTASLDWQSKTAGGAQLSADYVKKINLTIGYSYVENIELKFSNAQVLTVTDTILYEQLGKGLVSRGCQTGVEERLKGTLPVTMIYHALKADVQYRINFTTELEADVKLEVLKKIAPNLSGKVSSQSDAIMIGEGLFFGVIDDRELFASWAAKLVGSALTLKTWPEPTSWDRLFDSTLVLELDIKRPEDQI